MGSLTQKENVKAVTVHEPCDRRSGAVEWSMAEFKASWPRLVAELMEDPTFNDIHDSIAWLGHVLQENVPDGKQNRAHIGISLYFHMAKQSQRYFTAEDKFLVYLLGWVAEIMQAAALIADDIMDGAKERRGRPCWHRQPHVGASSFNDALMLENLGFHVMWKYFSAESHFQALLRVLMDTGFRTTLGQSLDTRLSYEDDLSRFTMETYKAIVKYKTAYYSFYRPFASAMIHAGLRRDEKCKQADEDAFKQMEALALEIGYLFQVQDDFLDCYGDSRITGKVGMDIRDRKCTWLIVTARQVATKEQRRSLEKMYGSRKKKHERIVKNLFRELRIEKRFRLHEEQVYGKIRDLVEKLPETIPKEPLNELLTSIYKRKK